MPSKREGKVIFRKIRGRIVPIRIKAGAEIRRGKKELVVGTGTAFVSAITGGLIVKKLNKEEMRLRKQARQVRIKIKKSRIKKEALRFGKAGAKIARKAVILTIKRRFALGTTVLGTAFGALLAETGGGRIAESIGKKEARIKTQFKENVVAIGVGTASSILFAGAAGGKKGIVKAIKVRFKRGF